MQIGGIRQGLQAQPLQKKIAPSEAEASEESRDTVTISEGGRALQEAQQVTRQRLGTLQRLTAARQLRIAEIREKVAKGLFSSREVIAQVADRILKGFGL